jgi:hypothetical protein
MPPLQDHSDIPLHNNETVRHELRTHFDGMFCGKPTAHAGPIPRLRSDTLKVLTVWSLQEFVKDVVCARLTSAILRQTQLRTTKAVNKVV